MKTNTITRTVKVTISNAELLNLFVQAIAGDAITSMGKQRTFYRALATLVGITDTDAVKIANANCGVEKEYRITVTEFRKWLPCVFAEFARAMLETDNES